MLTLVAITLDVMRDPTTRPEGTKAVRFIVTGQFLLGATLSFLVIWRQWQEEKSELKVGLAGPLAKIAGVDSQPLLGGWVCDSPVLGDEVENEPRTFDECRQRHTFNDEILRRSRYSSDGNIEDRIDGFAADKDWLRFSVPPANLSRKGGAAKKSPAPTPIALPKQTQPLHATVRRSCLWTSKEEVSVQIANFTQHVCRGKAVVIYRIAVTAAGAQWTVTKRLSELLLFRERLCAEFPNSKPPPAVPNPLAIHRLRTETVARKKKSSSAGRGEGGGVDDPQQNAAGKAEQILQVDEDSGNDDGEVEEPSAIYHREEEDEQGEGERERGGGQEKPEENGEEDDDMVPMIGGGVAWEVHKSEMEIFIGQLVRDTRWCGVVMSGLLIDPSHSAARQQRSFADANGAEHPHPAQRPPQAPPPARLPLLADSCTDSVEVEVTGWVTMGTSLSTTSFANVRRGVGPGLGFCFGHGAEEEISHSHREGAAAGSTAVADHAAAVAVCKDGACAALAATHAAQDGIVYYTVHVRNEHHEWWLLKRYSQFHALHRRLVSVQQYSSELNGLSFPEKAFLQTNTDAFLSTRQQALQDYIRGVVNIGRASCKAVVCLFLETNVTRRAQYMDIVAVPAARSSEEDIDAAPTTATHCIHKNEFLALQAECSAKAYRQRCMEAEQRLAEAESAVTAGSPLNVWENYQHDSGEVKSGTPPVKRDACEIATRLASLMLSLMRVVHDEIGEQLSTHEFMDASDILDLPGGEAAGWLNALRLRQALLPCTAFLEFLRATLELQDADLVHDLDSEARKLCFFINIYNVLTLHASLMLRGRHGPPAARSHLQRVAFLRAAQYRVGGFIFSLAEIEHAILRARSATPALWGGLSVHMPLFQRFSKNDPRSAVVLACPEPRVTFALHYCCMSGAAFRVYSPDRKSLEQQLAHACRVFLESEVTVQEGSDAGGVIVMVPGVFKWYAADFIKDGPARMAHVSEDSNESKADSQGSSSEPTTEPSPLHDGLPGDDGPGGDAVGTTGVGPSPKIPGDSSPPRRFGVGSEWLVAERAAQQFEPTPHGSPGSGALLQDDRISAAAYEREKYVPAVEFDADRFNPDEMGDEWLLEFCARLMAGVRVTDRTVRLTTHRKCFLGHEAVKWMVNHGEARTTVEAVAKGNLLIEAGLIAHCTNDHWFRDADMFYRFTSFETSDTPLDEFRGFLREKLTDASPLLRALRGAAVGGSIIFQSHDWRFKWTLDVG